VLAGAAGAGHPGSAGTGQADVTVQLLDGDGNVLATAVTGRQGRYGFDQLNGIGGTGDYTVRIVTPSGLAQVSPNPGTILISRGDVHVSGVNFRLAPV